MTIKAYIDTNIFIYAILKDPDLGEACKSILLDIPADIYEPAGSRLVAIEILGSLSRVDTVVARRATENYMKTGILDFDITPDVLRFAGEINEIINVRYDAIHAALMLLNGVDTIITNDLNDWKRLAGNLKKLLPLLKKFLRVERDLPPRLNVVSPPEYIQWRRTIV